MRTSDIQIRDPFVVQEDGVYWLFGSTDRDIWKGPGTGFDVYKSSGGLDEFDGPFPAFRPPKDFWAKENFWAPEVHKYRGAWYMFATFKPEAGRRGTAVLKSEGGVAGPYIPWSLGADGLPGPVTPAAWECLDGTFFEDEGKPCMVFCDEWKQTGDGEICALPLSEDLRRAAGEARLLFRASEAPWTRDLPGRAPGSRVTDGPFMYRAGDGGLLMLWSSFGEGGNYCIGTARSQGGTLHGPWVQSREPLYGADGGHGMLFKGRDGTLYLTIHSPNKTPFERPLFLAAMERKGEITLKI
ncbi:MAG: glycoside hydrolase family 43 protein [Spirochaetaceae bacterium]|jgi:GH43 family beta-xylosidase|nr:glycoside hydrolase family 43 protein [Spirochaetaceae bacterium]